MRKIHLDKSGSGWSSKTACGRNMLRTPMSAPWEEFKNLDPRVQCDKCMASKQAALNYRHDSKKQA